MEKSKSPVGILALVVVGGAAAYFLTQGKGDRSEAAKTPPPQEAPAAQPAEPEAPIKLRAARVADVREYFTAAGYSFEDKPLPGDVPRKVGTSRDGLTVIEAVGPEQLQQATLRYKLREGSLNGQDMIAVMYLMQQVKADEAELAWATDSVRKGEPATRTIGAVAYAIQRGPDGTNEFVMRPAPGFE